MEHGAREVEEGANVPLDFLDKMLEHLERGDWTTGNFTTWAYDPPLGTAEFRVVGMEFVKEQIEIELPVDSSLKAVASVEKPRLSDADQRRCAQAIIAYWGASITDLRAHGLAVGMNPDNLVPRDPFISILREFRPSKKPGRPTNSDKTP